MNIRPFEIALIGIFAVAGIVGIFFLSNYSGKVSDEAKLYGDRIAIWGTLDASVIDNLIQDLTQGNKALEVVEYTQIDSRTFENTLLNAIAEGNSPDLVILPHTLLVTYRTKLQPISFETLSERTFKDTYIDGAEIFMLSDGVYGIPFAADPLVMYWNKDIFSSSGLALPPKTWETLISQTTKAIVRTDAQLAITQSAVALGEFANIEHAKEVLSMLFFQAGSTIIDEQNASYKVTLNQGAQGALAPGDAVLTFFTRFVSPASDLYSWNRSKLLDRTEFLNGNLGMYFGLGSEENSIARDNANLSFDIAPVPQGSGVTAQRNYADFYAFVIPRATTNRNGAYAVATLLASPENAQVLIDGYNLAPVHRALFEGTVNDPVKAIIYQSALIARGWLDPSPSGSAEIFQGMIEEVTGGKSRLSSVIMDASNELASLF